MSNTDSKIALVTGANKGIGFDFVRLVADKYPAWTILLGSRSQANADAAVAKLAKKNVHALIIDVTSDESVRAAAAQVKAQYGRVDVLVHNAAIACLDVPSYEVAKSIIATNVFGVKRVDDAFVPLIPDGGRMIVVSSEVGSWAHHAAPAALRKQLEDDSVTVDTVLALATRYVESTRAPDYPHADEFPPVQRAYAAYGASKMLLSTYGRILTRQLYRGPRRIAVMLVSPGYCATDLNNNSGHRTSEQGALSYVLALERDAALSGRLFLDDNEFDTAMPQPQQ